MLNRFRVTGFIHFSIYTSRSPGSLQSHALHGYSPAASTRASRLALCTALVAAWGFSDKDFWIFWSLCENPDIFETSIRTHPFFLSFREKQISKMKIKGLFRKSKKSRIFYLPESGFHSVFETICFIHFEKQICSFT